MSHYPDLIQALGLKAVLLKEPLAKHTTFQIGGPADLFFVAKSAPTLKRAVQAVKKLKIPYFILGSGSNLLVSDRGFRGLVIKNQAAAIKIVGRQVKAESGVLVNQLVKKTIDQGLMGLESFWGLPGTVGGAIAGNAHFQGRHFRDFVLRVEKINGVILKAVFRLEPGDKKELWRAAKQSLNFRQTTQSWGFPSAGCIFKNPQSQPAGYLIDQSGLKGWRQGGAMVSDKHANFIVNTGAATCQDVLGLIALCQRKVKEKFGVELEIEIVRVGEADE